MSIKTELENLSKREAKNTEDCLVLDITRPSVSSDERLPVAIYIYGGSFTGGNGHDTMYNMTQYALGWFLNCSLASLF